MCGDNNRLIPEGMHPSEFVGSEEAVRQSIVIDNALRAYLQDEVHILRARAVNMLTRVDALGKRGGVAYFRYGDDVGNASDVLCRPNMDAYFLYVVNTSLGEYGDYNEPYMKLTLSEEIIVDDGVEYLTEDFTIDTDGDTYYNFSAFPFREQPPVAIPTVPSLFTDQTGCLVSAFYEAYPLPESVSDGDTVIYPYGCYHFTESMIDVLSGFKRAISSLETLDPVLTTSVN